MKRILSAFILLLTSAIVWFFGLKLPDIYLNIGKYDYNQKNYVSAYNNLKIANLLSPKNSDIRYYYAQTLIKLKPTLHIQKELYKISQSNLTDTADLIADRQISKWREQIISNIGENYIEQAPINNKIMRWDAKKFPLKVSIQKSSNTSNPQYYIEEIKKAFLKWQSETENFIPFSFTDNPSEADILINFEPMNKKECEGESCKYIVAYTSPSVSGDLLKKMSITFYDSNNLQQPFSSTEIYNTALHEIGHALGIMGHSYNKGDLMYMETNPDIPTDTTQMQTNLQYISQRDLNTLNLLYKMVPEITNTHMNKFDTNFQFFAPIVMGSEEVVNSRKMLEAQNYIKAAPNLPNGYMDLSSAYAEAKQYNKALEALEQALYLCSQDNEKFIIYYNFAVIYTRIKDWQNALKYAKIAKNLNPSADIDGLIAMIHFNLGEKEQAIKVYEEALEKTPTNTIDAYNLATIYVKEFNFIQAGKTLNKLIKANPEAKNDPRIRLYGILILLFK